MKKIIGALCLLIFGSSCIRPIAVNSSNTDQFKGKYAAYLESTENEVYSGYHYVYTIDDKGSYIKRVFFPETKQITSFTTYKNKDSYIQHGPFATWFDNGDKRLEGQYLDNEKTGVWHYYSFKTGLLSSSGKYVNDEKSEVWKYFDGNQLTEEVTYVNGMRDGRFVEYDSLGGISNEGLYKADTLFQSSTVRLEGPKLVEKLPFLKECNTIEDEKKQKECSDRALLTYIYKNIKYPLDAREYGIEGTVVVTFVIEKDGKMAEFEIPNGLCQSIKNECMRIAKSLPPWEAGRQDGEKVKVQFNLPIKYKLE